MDIGVWMSKQTLAHKLEARHEKNPEQAWNLANWPKGFGEQQENRLFVDLFYNKSPGFPFPLIVDLRQLSA